VSAALDKRKRSPTREKVGKHNSGSNWGERETVEIDSSCGREKKIGSLLSTAEGGSPHKLDNEGGTPRKEVATKRPRGSREGGPNRYVEVLLIEANERLRIYLV